MPLYRRDQIILFIGDLLVFAGSLWGALVLRHFDIPTLMEYGTHLLPFSVLFAIWLMTFVTVGLYEKHIALFEYRLPATITEAQIVNLVVAVLFFFTLPISIQPKTILALYFVISTALIVVWRLGMFRYRALQRQAESALIVGTGPDIAELRDEIRKTPRTRIECAEFLDSATVPPDLMVTQVTDMLQRYKLRTLILDSRLHQVFSALRENPAFDVIDASDLFEALFMRVPLSLLNEAAFLGHAKSRESRIYGVVKRLIDLVLALPVGLLSLIVYPIVLLGNMFKNRGVLMYHTLRIGQGGHPITIYKLRTMTGTDQGVDALKSKLSVTPFGRLLRITRVDELPQLWNVIMGDLSLIGPRPELPALVNEYTRTIPYYHLRHIVKPGLSGWAQIYHDHHPHHGTDVEATAEKLSYDLYYIKYRSIVLDLDIALKTLRIIASLAGR